jgi:hypothetical protein
MTTKRLNRKWIVGIAALLLVAASATAGWLFWPHRPDPRTASPAELAKFIASDDFGKLPAEQQQGYFDQAAVRLPRQGRTIQGAEGLSPQEREALSARLGEQRMKSRMAEYFKLPPEERTAYLDKQIDDMQARRDEMQARQDFPTSQPGGGGSSMDRRRERFENTDPLFRAERTQYFQDLRARMQQRGITFGGRR